MGEVSTVTGNPVRGAGWYGPNTGLHSVSIRALNFQGRVSIQASLAASPGINDWFSVLPDSAAFWQYPRVGYLLTGPNTGETSNVGFNFSCNVIWVRAIVDRSYLVYTPTETPCQLSYLGVIDNILLNY
jgi:hypothetical protein